eukprot:scaffold35837_cov30-Tisochrysis_lutea.AAC.1
MSKSLPTVARRLGACAVVCNSVRDRCVVPVRCNSSSPVPIPAPAPKAVGRIPMAWSCGCLIDALKRYPDSLIGRERGEPFIELEHERLTTGQRTDKLHGSPNNTRPQECKASKPQSGPSGIQPSRIFSVDDDANVVDQQRETQTGRCQVRRPVLP